MDVIIGHVVTVMLPVLLCVLLGYGLAVLRAPFDRKMFGSLVANVGYPALILSHLAKDHIELGAFLNVLLAAACMILIFGVLGFGILKLLGLPVQAYLSPMMLSNVGNIGLPVTTLAFGAEGAAVALGFVVVVLAAIFTIGVALPIGKPDFKTLAKQPVIYAVMVALVLMETGWSLPGPVDQSLSILAGLAVPIMLLTLGHSLATLKFGNLGRAATLSVIHICFSVVAALALTRVFPFSGAQQNAVILLCFVPPSVATYLAVSHHRPDDAPAVAGFIFLSTLMTLLTLPLVLTYWAA
jgi:predicted permease